MRRKNWKNPGTVYVDSQVFEQNIQVYASFEVFLEILEGLYKLMYLPSRFITQNNFKAKSCVAFGGNMKIFDRNWGSMYVSGKLPTYPQT